MDAKRSEMDPKYDPANWSLDESDYSEWYKEKSGDDLLALGDEEEKEGKE